MRSALPGICAAMVLLSCEQTPEQNHTAESVTWSADIAPIIFKHCSNCHRPGESGPFDLLSYRDAVVKARQIRFMTRTRQMPPWPADPSYTHFLGENVLSDE